MPPRCTRGNSAINNNINKITLTTSGWPLPSRISSDFWGVLPTCSSSSVMRFDILLSRSCDSNMYGIPRHKTALTKCRDVRWKGIACSTVPTVRPDIEVSFSGDDLTTTYFCRHSAVVRHSDYFLRIILNVTYYSVIKSERSGEFGQHDSRRQAKMLGK